MSDYRRLISYIYAYEGGEKGKNIGFAKIDMRGPQCRIQVNVKKVYVGSSDVGVYLLHAGGELLLGRILSVAVPENSVPRYSRRMWMAPVCVWMTAMGLPSMSWKMPGRVTRPSGRMRWHRRQKFSWQR